MFTQEPDLIGSDNAISLAQAARLFQVDGRSPAVSSVWRWCRYGHKGIQLAYGRVGRKLVTSRAACEQFMRDLAEADRREDEGRVTSTTPSSARTRRRDLSAERTAAGL